MPYCTRKCDYCAFYSVPAGGDIRYTMDRCTGRLIAEMQSRIPPAEKISFDTIYFGGGTPSLLGAENISRLISAITELAAVEQDAEITLETNPDHLSDESVAGFIGAGINRIVAGVQSFDRNFLSFIGRTARGYDIDTVKNFFSRADVNRSIDIICGPDKSVTASDCAGALELRPDHISFYMLSVEEGTPLSGRFEVSENFESGLAESFEAGINILKVGGYEHYEISNLCLPGKRSRHNMKYWRFEPYFGFGPSSHSFVNGIRSRNGMTAEKYLTGTPEPQVIDWRSPEQEAAEYVMTAIRLTEGLAVDAMREKLGPALAEKVLSKIPALTGRGFLDCDEKKIKLTWKGIMWSDSVAYALVEDFI